MAIKLCYLSDWAPFIFIAVTCAPKERQTVMSAPLIYVVDFLVVLENAVGSGRTSGHGICDMSHLSMRSFAVFMVSAVITVAIV